MQFVDPNGQISLRYKERFSQTSRHQLVFNIFLNPSLAAISAGKHELPSYFTYRLVEAREIYVIPESINGK